jgi:hypothetical protein
MVPRHGTIALVARSRCSCGAQVLWKADEPESDEWILVSKLDLPDQLDHVALAGVSTQCAFCRNCGHLWVAWGDGRTLSEYAAVDPNVRSARRSHIPSSDGAEDGDL